MEKLKAFWGGIVSKLKEWKNAAVLWVASVLMKIKAIWDCLVARVKGACASLTGKNKDQA